MPPNKNVQYARMSKQLKVLHGALISVVSVMNQPQRDEKLIEAAGIRLDRGCFRCSSASNDWGRSASWTWPIVSAATTLPSAVRSPSSKAWGS